MQRYTLEGLRRRLGLRPFASYAKNALRESERILKPLMRPEALKKHKQQRRCTGKSTKLFCQALVHAGNGGQVQIYVSSRPYVYLARERLRELVAKADLSQDILSRIHVGVLRPEGRVLLDLPGEV